MGCIGGRSVDLSPVPPVDPKPLTWICILINLPNPSFQSSKPPMAPMAVVHTFLSGSSSICQWVTVSCRSNTCHGSCTSHGVYKQACSSLQVRQSPGPDESISRLLAQFQHISNTYNVLHRYPFISLSFGFEQGSFVGPKYNHKALGPP